MDISGKTLCVLRNLKGLKQGQVAKELGVTQSAYSKLEKLDKIDKKHVNKIIKGMGYSPEEFEKASVYISTFKQNGFDT